MKKGFTLIELLAVIIILAIIALIATPIVLNVVEDVRIKARESSVLQYADGVKLAYAEEMLKNTGRPLKELADEKMSGEEVNCEVVAYSETQGVILSGCTVGKDDTKYYYLKELSTEKSAELIAYLGDTACVKATKTTYGVLATDDNPYVVGGEYNCTLGDGQTRTFFVLEEETETVSLIMDRNIGNSAWVTLEDYNAIASMQNTEACVESLEDGSLCSDLGPITAIKTLNDLTSGWNEVEVSLPNKEKMESLGPDYPEWTTSNLEKFNGNPIQCTLFNDEECINSFYHLYFIEETNVRRMYAMSDFGVINNFTKYDERYSFIANFNNMGIRPVITISKTLMK